MPDINQIEALIARVEAADGLDREIDGLLEVQARRFEAYRVGLTDATRAKWQTERGYVWDADTEYVAPRYTSSIDAIVGLIERQLPGWHGDVRLGQFPTHDRRERAVLWNGDTKARESVFGVVGDAATPALALCAAFLRAKLASEPSAAGGGP